MLQATGLHKAYGATEAVRGIAVEVAPGRIVGLVGNNGAGKTTSIKMFCGLVEPTSGTVRVLGGDPLRAPVRKDIGYLPEDSPLYEDLTPVGYLEHFGALYGMRRNDIAARATELLHRLRLDAEYWKVPIGRLSKGSARKVALARALLHDPAVVVLDEPSSGLDPATQRVLDRFLLELRDQGKAILLSAHDLEQVERVCDEVLVMHRGRIVLSGTLAELRGRAGSTRYRLRATVAFEGSAPDGPDHVGHVEDWPAAEACIQEVRAADGRLLDLQAESPHLADVLMAVSED